MKMKLNTKRTVCVGFAFFLICAFWQAYDTIIPKILTDRFGMSQGISGFIMALDNIFALFLLPLFGVLSDKCRSKLGRRTPFILGGTLLAVAALFALSAVAGAQLDRLGIIGDIDSPEARCLIYDAESEAELVTPDGERFVLSEKFTRDEFAAVPSLRSDGSGKADDDYTAYVVPARQAYVKIRDHRTSPRSALRFYCGVAGIAFGNGNISYSRRGSYAGCYPQATQIQGECNNQSYGHCWRQPYFGVGNLTGYRKYVKYFYELYRVFYDSRRAYAH